MAGSQVKPLTSLTISAPAWRAARATEDLYVSMERMEPRALALDGLDDGQDAVEFLLGGDGSGERGGLRGGGGYAGAGGFAADVEDVGTFVEEREAVSDGRPGIGVQASVGERIGGDVEDPHDEGSLAERKPTAAEIPLEARTHGGALYRGGVCRIFLAGEPKAPELELRQLWATRRMVQRPTSANCGRCGAPSARASRKSNGMVNYPTLAAQKTRVEDGAPIVQLRIPMAQRPTSADYGRCEAPVSFRLPTFAKYGRMWATKPQWNVSQTQLQEQEQPQGQLQRPTSADCIAGGPHPVLVLFLDAGCESAHDELLYQAVDEAAAGGDKGILHHQPGAAIRCRIIGIRESGRGQVATYARVVRLQAAVVSLADEWAGECVESARLALYPCPGRSSAGPDAEATAEWHPRT